MALITKKAIHLAAFAAITACTTAPPIPKKLFEPPPKTDSSAHRPEAKQELFEGEEDFSINVPAQELPFPKEAEGTLPKVVLTPGEPFPDLSKSEGEDDETIVDSRNETLALYEKGYRQTLRGEWDQAARSFERYLEATPDSVYADWAQAHRAEAYLRTGDYGIALTVCQNLERESPDSLKIPNVLWTKARVYQEQGFYEAALATLNRLLERFPDHPLAEKAKAQKLQLFKPNFLSKKAPR